MYIKLKFMQQQKFFQKGINSRTYVFLEGNVFNEETKRVT